MSHGPWLDTFRTALLFSVFIFVLNVTGEEEFISLLIPFFTAVAAFGQLACFILRCSWISKE